MNWIKNIGNAIFTAIKAARIPLQSIPPILLLCEIMQRPGLSATALTSATISRLEANEIPTGMTECGIPNMDNKFIKIVAEETIKHIKDCGKADFAAPPMTISFIGTGGNAGGPIVMTLYNNNFIKFSGLPR